MTDCSDTLDISIVVPAFNERETLAALVAGVRASLQPVPGRTWEILFIDDGSQDGSWDEMTRLAAEDGSVHAIRMRRNFGKAMALSVGFRAARGRTIVTMDADLQDDPQEIPRFLDKLEEGYDLVSGWKERRQDPLDKTLPSRLFNAVTSKVSGVKLRDFNCGFKAYRAGVVRNIRLYGELHRYIPVLAHAQGFRIGEIPVQHHPRRFGVSKYGLERYVRGLLDLLTVVALTRYSTRPGHLFGGIGVALGLVSAAVLAWLTGVWLFTDNAIGHRPLLSFGVMTGVIAVQLVCFGMLAELIVAKGELVDPACLVAETSRNEPPGDS
ncbi:glycosyltransferase family 2 protein [Magnetospirillum moscoviense]|uniref:Glycosyl transferase family 2 n=1 Tax=Magnetospirillum moscoviense TaxID=1437059 RepID=A0A178MVZ5_9PROT|nr:glycosyltransferase family 2 protein [Magnetospirillum moscoviense]OAN54990.1 glycosyl transferase family 2 [Magnetospirillum moscoviense]